MAHPGARIDGAGTEVQTSAAYRFNNWRRSPEQGFGFVVQRTLAGEGWIATSSRRYPVPPGRAMLFTHNERSRYGYPEGSTTPYRLHWVAISGPWLERFYRDLRARHGPVVRMPDDGESCELLSAMVAGFFQGRLTTEDEVMLAGTRLLAAIDADARMADGELDPVSRARSIAERDYATGLNLKQLALRVGLSREHLTRAFSGRFAESPGAFLRRLRLTRAVQLLGSSRTTPVADIASACGFGSPQAFSRAIRSAYGKTAEELRQNLRPNRS